MTVTRRQLEESIRAERRARADPPFLRIAGLIASGQATEALSDLVFFTSPDAFLPATRLLLEEIKAVFPASAAPLQESMARFLADLSIALVSFLPQWNLRPGGRLKEAGLNAVAERAKTLVADLARSTPAVTESLLQTWRAQALARFKAESAPNAERLAASLAGGSLSSYIDNMQAAVRASNLRHIAEMRAAGRTPTEISNDYAAFTDYAMLLGASFVTCNPPLIDIAWASDPTHWDPLVDEILSSQPDDPADDLARRVTLEIVYANMRLLRPIFLVTEGQMGCVSLQVNPKRHDDSQAMIRDATAIYAILQAKLEGGVPNVVFKLPATKAGLEACRALTQQAIGVNITVSFGLFQELAFAEVIAGGQSLFSTITHMTGRLAFAVRDELLAATQALFRNGITEDDVRSAAAWSGIAVIKKFHGALGRLGVDTSRVRPLVASLRVYEGAAYAGLPTPIPDITEALGTRIITVFPNVRRAYDQLKNPQVRPSAIDQPVPARALEILRHSEVFKQAYYVEAPLAVADRGGPYLPAHPLSLADEAAVADWPPVKSTLSEFCLGYDRFVQKILERRRKVSW
ncbi:MAG: hypothetical protein A2Y93_11475 [Chloroflexi bacterium RBG_13_68_17]|nr:MAG: hypothetical protein A2Y93_11475 [Chloroflexi bacterium RBG_13_68_17]